MSNPKVYGTDLAYIHDQGYGGFARGSAPGLLKYLREAGISNGRIVDLGCGSGIWARELANAGYEVVGADLSPDMIELARQRVPAAEFHVASFVQFDIPHCRAVTAIGEVFSYLFDPENSLQALRRVCTRVFDALASGGLLIFDVAEPKRHRGLKQAFREGDDWTCLVEYRHDDSKQQLTRRIVTFRKTGETYVRGEETHGQQLYTEESVMRMLQEVGFRARVVPTYGDYALAEGVAGFVAEKP